MVNNSTNINKLSNHLSPKESLNCDGQQNIFLSRVIVAVIVW